jgi:molybdopterin converting factor small subunit
LREQLAQAGFFNESAYSVYRASTTGLLLLLGAAAALIGWLKGQGEEYAYAFENGHVIRVAIDQTHVKHDAPIAGAREIAFFPPMTGG